MLVEKCTRMGCYCYTSDTCSTCQLPYCFWHLHSLIMAPGNHTLLCETCLHQTDVGISVSQLSVSDIPLPWEEKAKSDEPNPLLQFDLPLNWEERFEADESNPDC